MEGRDEEGFQQILEDNGVRRSRFFEAPEAFQPLFVHGFGFPHNQLIQKLFLGTEVVMDSRQIDPGSSRNATQGNGFVALLAEQLLCSVQNLESGFTHSNDLIIRLS